MGAVARHASSRCGGIVEDCRDLGCSPYAEAIEVFSSLYWMLMEVKWGCGVTASILCIREVTTLFSTREETEGGEKKQIKSK